MSCICSITKSTDQNFTLHDPLTAESPAAAFAMLIGTHFDRQRSTGIIVYDHFKVDFLTSETLFHTDEKESLTLGQLRERLLNKNIERIKAQLKEKKIQKLKGKAKELLEILGDKSL